MISIKCSNLQCTSPTKSFDWDETEDVENSGGIAPSRERGAVRVIVVCPFCSTENVVWVKGVKRKDEVEEEEE